MRVVFDSNVWIAALTASGTCHDLVLETIGAAEVWISRALVAEVVRVLSKRFDATSAECLQVRKWLERVCRVVEPPARKDVSCRDPSDLPVLWLALFAHADFIVTGDRDLLDLKEVRGIPIIPPALLWKELF